MYYMDTEAIFQVQTIELDSKLEFPVVSTYSIEAFDTYQIEFQEFTKP